VKGDIVESIVAAMHMVKGATVQQNVRLASLNGGRLREFDVVVDGTFAGYPVRLAIECKNEREITGAPKIDAFVGKLQHVGIPPSHGIFVSAKGFTRGALDRARHAGIRPLVLTGLTEDRLAAVVHEAFQSVIFLLPVVRTWQVASECSSPKSEELFLLRDQQGNVCGTVADLVWRAWLDGAIPRRIGVHRVKLTLPIGWHQIVGGQAIKPVEFSAEVHVQGVAASVRGTAARHDLINADTKRREKTTITTTFHEQEESFHAMLTLLETEEAKSEFLTQQRALVRVIVEAPLPRLAWNGMFWPPSDKYIQTASQISPEHWANPDNSNELNWKLQGGSFTAMWDPLWESPMLSGILNAKFPTETG